MSTLSQLQQQINEAEAKISELRKKLDEERKTERTQAIATARDLIKTYGLMASELGFSGKTSAKSTASGDKRVAVPPKYKDPASGKTWTGRGKTPVWMATQLANGRSRQDFLI
jgi:DNA-binding protein H-NS